MKTAASVARRATVSRASEMAPLKCAAAGLLLALWGVQAQAVPLGYSSGALDFSTDDQSVWGTGQATVLTNTEFYGAQWTNKSTTIGGIIGDVSETTVYTNPLWWAWKACKATVDFLCGNEPGKGAETLTVDTRTGAEVTLTTSGKFGFEVGYLIDAGSIDADVQFVANAELPDKPVKGGEAFDLNASTLLSDGLISTQSPTAKAWVNAIAELSADVTAKGCLIALGCLSGSGNLVDIDGNLPLLAVDPNAVEILPELLPPKTTGGDREPLLKADLFNQALTLQGSLDAALVPGFKLASNFGTLADSNPNIVPSLEIDLASLEFQVPEIQATGGVVGSSLKAEGRDDFLKLKADVDGIATMSGTMPPFGAGISLVDVGSGATNFKIAASLDALDIDMGPDLGIAQDFELKPTLMAKILFSAPVMIAGAMVDFWEGVWDELPEITLFTTTTFSPTYYLDVLLDHQMALDLGLSGTLDLFKASLTASMGGVKLLGGEISLNQLLGLGNTLFQTSRAELPIWAKEFALMGFPEIEGAAFTVQVPTPATLLLLALGITLLGAGKRQRRPDTAERGWSA